MVSNSVSGDRGFLADLERDLADEALLEILLLLKDVSTLEIAVIVVPSPLI